MKLSFLPLPFALLFLAPAVYAEGVCEPVARGMETAAETPRFIMTVRDSERPHKSERTTFTPDSLSPAEDLEDREVKIEVSMRRGIREEGQRLRQSTTCVALGEETLDGVVTLVFAPEGEDEAERFWIGKSDGHVYKATPTETIVVRFRYQDTPQE